TEVARHRAGDSGHEPMSDPLELLQYASASGTYRRRGPLVSSSAIEGRAGVSEANRAGIIEDKRRVESQNRPHVSTSFPRHKLLIPINAGILLLHSVHPGDRRRKDRSIVVNLYSVFKVKMATLNEITKEKQRLGEALTRVDAQREKLVDQLSELEAAERV